MGPLLKSRHINCTVLAHEQTGQYASHTIVSVWCEVNSNVHGFDNDYTLRSLARLAQSVPFPDYVSGNECIEKYVTYKSYHRLDWKGLSMRPPLTLFPALILHMDKLGSEPY